MRERVRELVLPDGQRVRVREGALQLLATDGRVLRAVPCADLRGEAWGEPIWLAHHGGRRSVIAAFPAFGELWELPLDAGAPPVFDGLVHDWRMAEAIAKPGWFTPRRLPLGLAMPQQWTLAGPTGAEWPWVAGALADRVWIVHLDVRRVVAQLPLPGAQLAGAVAGERKGDAVWRVPTAHGVSEVDARGWVIRPAAAAARD